MPETLTLAAPETPPSITAWTVEEVYLVRGQNPPATAYIVIILRSNTGERYTHRYSEDEGWTLLKQLNTMNFSATSFNTRILQRLSADGVKVGTVAGTPE